MSNHAGEVVVSCSDIVVDYPQPSVKTNTLKEFLLRKISRSLTVSKHHALNGVSLTASRGECVALVGHNGCGKSTLLKVIAGIITPTGGAVQTYGRLAPLIELGAGFDPELTGRENVFLSCSLLGLSQAEIHERLSEIRIFAGLGEFFDAPVKTYSSGMYMRLGFACSTAIEPDVLLIDEILAVGDENFQKKCVDRMHTVRESGATIVLVSHDLNTVRSMANRAIVLDHGDQVFSGSPDDAVRFYLELMDKARIEALPEAQRAEEFRRARLAKHATTAFVPEGGREGRGTGKVTKAVVAGPNGVDLKTGEAWSLTFDVNLNLVGTDRERPVVVGFAIHSASHIRVFGGNTKLFAKGVVVDPVVLATSGKHKVKFFFDRLDLASGQYYVVAAIHNWEMDMTLDYQPHIVDIEVRDPKDGDNFDHDLVPVFSMFSSLQVD